ncbi:MULTISPECIES: AAA family ATPase [Cohnella]|uniref:AAA family ATPase n=1 Tax=Cohnella TaxID=329857 RepID=UPI001592C900|nr:ATP-binding protein [Cohnella massiliensis]MBN2983196.1 ATP-binding protein [Cohnella algarum]
MLSSFSAKKFRNLNIEHLKLNKLNVFVGPNNSGKSNLIDAISFISEIVKFEKDQAYPTAFWSELNKRAWGSLLDRQSEKPATIELNWILQDGQNRPLQYDFCFRIPESGTEASDYRITKERLADVEPRKGHDQPYEYFSCHSHQQGKGYFSARSRTEGKQSAAKRPGIAVSPFDSVMNQLEQLLNHEKFRTEYYPNFKKSLERVKQFFEDFRAYSSTKFDLLQIRGGELQPSFLTHLKQDGSNLASLLELLEKKYPGFLSEYAGYLRELIPDLQNIMVDVSGGLYRKTIRLQISNHLFALNEVSDGTIKAMLLAVLLWTPQKFTLLSLDEPELNIHPAWLKVISNWITRSGSSEQVMISTHSPDFLDGLTPLFRSGELNVYRFSLNKPMPMIEQIELSEFEPYFQEGWELGDIYRTGKLGGWPWL